MITLRVCSPNKTTLISIANQLLKEKLVIDINLVADISRLKRTKGQLKESIVHEMQAKTKALLFPTIDEYIRKNFSPVPEIYSSPIVHMDWEQSHQLVKEVKNV
ncbi:MAG: divalent cation tolerance protein CutA [Schleiferiaceae bacterium]|jgi:uncharacterized protein involved in tolerance to divalent cations|nr:divalent cation tolerance protein CutA [Schleiferiaceae bacterium]